jgi:hypothetical protein
MKEFIKELNASLQKHNVALTRDCRVVDGYKELAVSDELEISMNSTGMSGSTVIKDKRGGFLVGVP